MNNEREKLDIPEIPLTPEQTLAVCEKLTNDKNATLETAELLTTRVAPGVTAAAKIKTEFLYQLAISEKKSALISRERAIFLLGTMYGGYNIEALIKLLSVAEVAPLAANVLVNCTLIFAHFALIEKLYHDGNPHAKFILQKWANAEWFTATKPFPEKITVRVFRVNGVITTDDFSPASQAVNRSDIPLHAMSMGGKLFPDGIKFMRDARARNEQIAFVGDTVGVGSSRKSATNSLMWHIGEDIEFVPNKRRGGIVLGATIAPIFFNTFADAGGIPLVCEVGKIKNDTLITIDFKQGKIFADDGEILSTFTISSITLPDEYRAGGRMNLIIGKQLTQQSALTLAITPPKVFIEIPATSTPTQHFTLAQKIVGRACGKIGVSVGENCQPQMTTVISQDTTGPMTRDELTELACLKFSTPLFLQSFCHTAAYPTAQDKTMHETLPQFITERGGVALRPGDGIIHSWANRMLLPDTVGTGGDSHTRFPLGISFAAGSGLVAFAGALGCLPLTMPESVLVKLKGKLRDGITWRDVVNYIALKAIQLGMQSPFGQGDKNVFNGRIMEFEGVTQKMRVEDAFELTCASAERSVSACTIDLSENAVKTWLHESCAIIKKLIAQNYQTTSALQIRCDEIEKWLHQPQLLHRDDNAEFAATIEIDLNEISEPILALPNNPDNVGLLSEHSGREIDEVFIGSCMTNAQHFRDAEKILRGKKLAVKQLWITPPTNWEKDDLENESILPIFRELGARVEIPGCSLCMGNQARVADNAVVFSTSTRNFNDRMGNGAQVYLGSARVAAVIATLGKIPTVEEYFNLTCAK